MRYAQYGISIGYGSVAFNIQLPDPGYAGSLTTDPALRRLAGLVETEQTNLTNLAIYPVPWDLHNAMQWAIDEWSTFWQGSYDHTAWELVHDLGESKVIDSVEIYYYDGRFRAGEARTRP